MRKARTPAVTARGAGVADMTVPTEVFIDTLVLRGVSEHDALLIVATFSERLEHMLEVGGPLATDADLVDSSPVSVGTRLAMSVARTIEQARPL